LICLASGPVGCGSKKGVTVKGKVVLPPNVKLDKEDSINLRFVPTKRDKTGKSGTGGSVSPSDLTFTIKDVEPGSYKIGATFSAYPGKDNKEREKSFMRLNKEFDPEESSKLTFEVTSDPEQSIVVDFVAGTVSKQ
jgi:hypothetical protein